VGLLGRTRGRRHEKIKTYIWDSMDEENRTDTIDILK
jgi:hypothetical protein